jgi:hypothetical protein
VVRVFAGLSEILESWMRRGIRNELRTELLGHQPGEAFVQPHSDFADAVLSQANGSGEHQARAIRFQ